MEMPMSTGHHTTRKEGEILRSSRIPPISKEKLELRNRRAMALLDEWERNGDEQEQRETMQVLRAALGENRTTSNRPLFP
jgi:hypothetical protein